MQPFGLELVKFLVTLLLSTKRIATQPDRSASSNALRWRNLVKIPPGNRHTRTGHALVEDRVRLAPGISTSWASNCLTKSYTKCGQEFSAARDQLQVGDHLATALHPEGEAVVTLGSPENQSRARLLNRADLAQPHRAPKTSP